MSAPLAPPGRCAHAAASPVRVRPPRALARAALAAASALALAAAPAGCRDGSTLRVFAASSLTESFTEIGRDFESAHPDVTVEFVFAGSQTLKTQIEHGARADFFASADTALTAALHRAGLLETPRRFAQNALVIVAPHDEMRIREPADLAAPGVSVVLAGPGVPAGRYASDALGRMEASGRFGDGFAARVRANVVSEEPNVRAVLAKVALGEADAGIVYLTDAAAAGAKVRTITIPRDWAVATDYAVGICRRAPHPNAARAFVDHLLGPEGRARLLEHRFEVP